MAAPVLVHNYPANGDTGIPVGETIELYFDKGVDLQKIKESVVLYGNDFDKTSGPDSAVWVNPKTGENPFFLSSPGFKGVVPLEFELVYWDTTDTVTYAEVTPGVLTSEADELAGNYGHKVKITPKDASLQENLSYTLYVNGDPESAGDTGAASRTVFDVVPDAGNVGTDGSLKIYGTWDGSASDTINIEVTEAGDIGVAKFKWWYTSAGSGSAVSGRVTSRRYRKLADGLQVRFTGSGFVLGDVYTIGVEPVERLATSYKIDFTTNDGSWVDAPADISTPASSTPPASVLPTIIGSGGSSATALTIASMLPEDGAYNISVSNREIVIEFSEAVDAATITDDTIKLWAYPVDGHHEYTWEPYELEKELSVSGSTLTITF